MKTQFEELYSEILYTQNFDHNKIIFWYLGETGLKTLQLNDIEEKDESLFVIADYSNGIYSRKYIPIYRIYVVSYGPKLLMDRRIGYKGTKNMDLPSSYFINANL